MVRERAWPADRRYAVGASALNGRFRANMLTLLSTHWSNILAINIEILREKLARNFRTDTLDDFRSHLEISLRQELKSLEREHAAAGAGADLEQDPDLTEEYRSHLESLMESTKEVLQLGYELSIVALYRRVETHLNKVLRNTFPKSAGLASSSDQLKAKHPFIATLPNLAAFDELRLLNNDVKHGDGLVSKRLAMRFPGSGWVEGAPLEGLDTHLQRLQPKVESFIQEFVTGCYAEMRAAASSASAGTPLP